MTRVNFKNRKDAFISATRVIAMATVIGVVTVSCGGGGGQKQGAALDKATEKMVEEASKGMSFTKAGQTKIASFGKTEQGKRIVAYDDYPNSSYCEYYIVGNVGYGWGSTVYRIHYDTEQGKRYYNRYIEDTPINDKDDNGLWIEKRASQEFSSWQAAYDNYKNEGSKIVE